MKNERAWKWYPRLWVSILGLVSFPLSSIAVFGDEYWDSEFGVSGADGPIYTISAAGGCVYFGGQFSRVGGINVTNIAKWDGTHWESVGGGITGGVFPNVLASAELNGEIFVGGLFTEAAGQPASNIARWDGTNWFTLGSGVNSIVRAMATDGTNLYAAGTFTQAGGINATNIAKWDGTTWSALGGGIPGQAVDSVAVGGGYVYAGGRFIIGGTIQATNIARWNGTSWSALGKGIRASTGDGGGSVFVQVLLTNGSELYAGGGFRFAGDAAVTNIARWDGTNWSTLGGGISGEVYTLIRSGHGLFAGGYFGSAGNVQANDIAQWDGQAWSSLGAGIGDRNRSATVLALACNGSELFVGGGGITTAGGKSSTNIALWHIPHSITVERVGNQLRLSWPATGSNFILEACAQSPGTNWTEVPQSPVLVDDQLVVTNQLDGDSRFYRLRRR